MLQDVLQQEVPVVEIRWLIDRLPDGRTWTYQPIAWRLPEGKWARMAETTPLRIQEIEAVEEKTGFKLDWLGDKLSLFEWVYCFKRVN